MLEGFLQYALDSFHSHVSEQCTCASMHHMASNYLISNKPGLRLVLHPVCCGLHNACWTGWELHTVRPM